MRVIRRISAVLIGFVFFLAGILKLMDPVGARLVVEEYLKFLHLNFLMGAAGLLGSGMALLEALVGAALITGVWRRVMAVVTGVMLGAFTLLTVLLYIKNPNIDCGCFGEIIHLTHAQSLIKNLILLAMWAIAFLPFRKIEITRKVKYVSFPIAAASICFFLLYSSFNIPLVDFTPFKPGAELMLPWDIDDPTDNRTPTLSISDASGEYVDEKLVEGQLVVVSVYDPEKMRANHWARVQRVVQDAKDAGFTPMVLAASTPEEMHQLVSSHEVLDATYFADRKKLLTLNRSNGGATYLADGLIVDKWTARTLPDGEKLAALMSAEPMEAASSASARGRFTFQGGLLLCAALLILL